MQRVIGVLGTPNSDDMNFIGNPAARRFIHKLPRRERMKFSSLYPKANPVALDLLDKMLIFNPEKRWTVEQCLAHPYFRDLHNSDEEPLASGAFDWSFDNFEPTKEILQTMIYQESLRFHPD